MQAFKNTSFFRLLDRIFYMTCLYIFNIFIEIFCMTMKTGVFESLHYKIIIKKNYYGSCPYIHSTIPVPKRKISCCNIWREFRPTIFKWIEVIYSILLFFYTCSLYTERIQTHHFKWIDLIYSTLFIFILVAYIRNEFRPTIFKWIDLIYSLVLMEGTTNYRGYSNCQTNVRS